MKGARPAVKRGDRPWLVFVSTRAPYPPVTGHFIRTLNILRQISGSYRIALFAFYDKNLDQVRKAEVSEALGKICDFLFLKDIESERSVVALCVLALRAAFGRKPLVAYKYFDKEMAASIQRVLDEHDVALVHLDMLPLVEYLDSVGEERVSLTQHNIESDRLLRIASTREGLLARWFLNSQARKLARFEANSLKKIRHCCVVSENDERAIMALNDKCDVHIVRNGVDTAMFSPTDRDLQLSNNLLWVGGMNDEYNKEAVVHFARNIFPLIRQGNPSAIWTVIGKSPPPEIVVLADQGYVELAGFVDDLLPYYGRAAVVVVPLLSGAGTKLKVIEAMAMGKATVVTPVGAEGIAEPGDEFLCIAPDSATFARQVLELMNDVGRRHQIGEMARAEVLSRFDWNTIGLAQIEAYKKLREAKKCVE